MDDPWFDYFRGRGRLHIMPRNGRGWAATLALVAVISLPALAMPALMAISPWLLAPYFALLLVAILLFIRWAKSRSRVIDLDEVGRDYAEFQEWKKRHRR